ncbi:MFS transporter [Paenarthrobacter sp. AMU7]|uniref:MFS transporter n=1 Tax=Paenarthrobacter sp. AMU7 TaxID=3162492 RepID=A0AB39YHV5_9MICC
MKTLKSRTGSGVKLNLLAFSQGLSSVGASMTTVALMLAFQSAGASTWTVTLLLVLSLLPSVVLGPLVAPWLDRIETTKILSTTLTLRGCIGIAIAFTSDVTGLLVLLGVASVVSVIDGPAMTLLVPKVQKPGAEPMTAFARMETFRSMGIVLGPLLAGVLVDQLGSRIVLLIDAGSFLLVAAVIVLLGVRRYPPENKRPTQPSWFKQVAAGPQSVGKDALVRTATLSLAGAIIFTALLTVAQIYFVRTDLQASATIYGGIVAVHALGRFLAATFVAPKVPVAQQPRMLFWSGMLMGAALLTVALGHSIVLAFVGFLLTGAANSLQALAIRSIVHDRLDHSILGRAFSSIGALNNGATLLGATAGAPLVALLGGAGTLAVAGIGTMAATLAAAPGLIRKAAPKDAAADVGKKQPVA